MKNKILLLLMVLAILFVGCEKQVDPMEDDASSDVVNINPDYVPIDWTTSAVQSYNDSTGNYVIQFSNTVPDLHQGSVIAIDRDTTVLYRYVTAVNTSGNTLTISSVEASLNDIFYDSRFTLSTAATKRKSVSDGPVFYPVSAYIMGEDGTYHEIDLSGTLKADTRFTDHLWNNPLFNLDGINLVEGDHYRLWLEKFNASMKVDLKMILNFGGRTEVEVINGMIERYRSRTMRMDTYVIGSFDTEQRIRFDASNSFSYSPEYQLLRHDLFKPVPIRFEVPAGPVTIPVVVWLRCDLFYQYQVSGSGEISAYMGFTDHAEGHLGMEWSQASGITPVKSFENTFNYTPPTVEGKGQLQGKVWLFPRIKLMLYDRIGPSIDVMPWLADTVRGGFREEMLGQSNDYCAWSIDHYAGLDVRFGLSRNNILFGNEVANDTTPKFTLADIHLYHSPRKVLHASGRPLNGSQATISFDVYDTNYLAHSSYKTLYPQIVKFEAGGQLSSEYGIAVPGTGRVSVQWTPSGEGDILYAKLYGIDGEVLAWDTVKAGEVDDWVDLGLPSGLLWATRNVGASSPTDYGNYYAWGETSPQSSYTWDNYLWWSYDSDGNVRISKYNTSSDYGPVDNLITLQSSDDAATANYGGRMPTKDEWQELLNNTISTWTTINGVNGRRFSGSNGNSIFLPAASLWRGTGAVDLGREGGYWSSTLNAVDPDNADDPEEAMILYFDSDEVFLWDEDRPHGLSVRAVRQN